MTRAALYIRVSTDEQSASAEAQESGARAWCDQRGFVVVAVYRDVGISGAEWQRRAGILQLQLDAEQATRAWDVLVVMFQDRLGRDAARVGLLLSDLHDADVKVYEWARDAELVLDSMGQLYATLRAHMAKHEREMAAARTYAALAHKARRGLVVGGAVYGYRNERRSDGVYYVVHPDEALVVQEIYRRATEGQSARTIAHALNDQRYPSPRADGGGTGSWATSEVYAILRSERYKGTWRWGQKGSRYRRGTRETIARGRADVIEVHAPELAIIDAETWQAAQRNADRTRTETDQPKRRARARYLLVGLAMCSVCGGPLGSGRTSRGRVVIPSYVCLWHRDRGKSVCPAGYSKPVDVVDAVVLRWVVEKLLDAELLRDVALEARRRAQEPTTHDPAVEALQSEERDLSTRIHRLTLAIETGAGDVPELARSLAARNRRLAEVRAELARLTTPAPVIPLDLVAQIAARVEDLRRVIARAQAERPDLLRTVIAVCFVGRIRVTPTGSRGELRLEGKATPGALLSILLPNGEQGTRGNSATPTGFEPVLPT